MEAQAAMDAGATEIDIVLDYTLFATSPNTVADDVCALHTAVAARGGLVKVILEVSELNLGAVAEACALCVRAGVAFVKTSTGFSSGGATAEAVQCMRANFAHGGVKISGGVRSSNVWTLLAAAGVTPADVEAGLGSGQFDPRKTRIGESSLFA
eukprot:gnl/Spiro4/22059_TR10849_c0_g4_i1.p2 gnl/Spiro4/22059_TR10849_c0_g4~~gnl/Spiro4/22059_TR10849_c0_g4_i1.p2  ORF type:complete len:154 (-),score=54.73 gnl/Spiro4/22059_TR10849_c0_g4_i1:58-519(-)